VFGKIDLTVAQQVLIVGSVIALVTDFIYLKIYNWLTGSMMLIGIAVHYSVFGTEGIVLALIGIAVGFFVFGWMYVFKAMAAGDVKLLMGMGALMGWKFALQTGLFSILIGGMMAIGVLLFKGKLRAFVHKVMIFGVTLFNSSLKIEFPKADQQLKMPFGVALAISAIIHCYYSPLESLGIRL
jgi:prepilin peptidase CpaA